MSFLEVDGIHVSYGFAKVLHGVSIKIDKGQFVFIVGRNGAGKTTLLKSICGLLRVSQGKIVYDGRDITRASTEELALMGIRYVAQDKRVFNSLTVKENLELAAYASGEPLAQTLERTITLYPQLEGLLNLKAGRLSGGQKEILLIARALTGNPKLLLLDEPTEGLASIMIEEVARLLEAMKGGVTAIVVEQNLNIVRRLADRVYMMREGRIGEEITETDAILELEKFM